MGGETAEPLCPIVRSAAFCSRLAARLVGSMRTLEGTLAQRCRDFLEAAEHVVMQPDHLCDDDVRIFTIFREALHHRAEQRLREPRRTIQGLFHGQSPRPFRAFNLIPDLVEQHPGTPLPRDVSIPVCVRWGRSPTQLSSQESRPIGIGTRPTTRTWPIHSVDHQTPVSMGSPICLAISPISVTVRVSPC